MSTTVCSSRLPARSQHAMSSAALPSECPVSARCMAALTTVNCIGSSPRITGARTDSDDRTPSLWAGWNCGLAKHASPYPMNPSASITSTIVDMGVPTVELDMLYLVSALSGTAYTRISVIIGLLSPGRRRLRQFGARRSPPSQQRHRRPRPAGRFQRSSGTSRCRR